MLIAFARYLFYKNGEIFSQSQSSLNIDLIKSGIFLACLSCKPETSKTGLYLKNIWQQGKETKSKYLYRNINVDFKILTLHWTAFYYSKQMSKVVALLYIICHSFTLFHSILMISSLNGSHKNSKFRYQMKRKRKRVIEKLQEIWFSALWREKKAHGWNSHLNLIDFASSLTTGPFPTRVTTLQTGNNLP